MDNIISEIVAIINNNPSLMDIEMALDTYSFSSLGEAWREIIYNNVYDNLDQANGLSNGDTVTYEFTVDNGRILRRNIWPFI